MLITILFILSSFTWVAADSSPIPTDFKTDYCTNYPEGPKDQPDAWKHCCLKHDLYFWAGGSKQNRYDADGELKTCIAESGYPRQAEIMYRAVRLGSYSPIKYPDRRWGNAWEKRPEFKSLSLEEIQAIKTELDTDPNDLTDEFKNSFISDLLKRKN